MRPAERARRDADFYLAAASFVVIFFASVVVLGFYAPWIGVALVCWIFGGAGVALFGLFWIGAIREWVRTR